MDSFTKYIITDNTSKANEHWDYCVEKSIPYITAMGGRKYYRVSMDMFCTPFNLTDEGIKKVSEIMNEEAKHFSETSTKKVDVRPSHTLPHIYPVQKERIEELCSKLFEIGMMYRESSKVSDMI
jgi:hypothetical protein